MRERLLPALVILGFVLHAAVFLACGDKYNGPFTPGSATYVGDEWSHDGDGNGVADSLEKYLPDCSKTVSECVKDGKILSGIYGGPRSLAGTDMIVWKGEKNLFPRLEFSPENLGLRGYVLTSSDSGIVLPSGDRLEARQSGSARITATIKGDSMSVAFRVTVADDGIPVEGISGLDVNLSMGKDTVPSLIWLPPDASHKDYVLTSENQEVAVVVNNRILGVKSGSSMVTVTTLDGARTARLVAIVSGSGREIHPDSVFARDLYLVAGGVAEAPDVSWIPDSTTDKKFLLVTSDALVANISLTPGKVTPLAAGRARVTLITLDGGKSAEFMVHVATSKVALKGIRSQPMILVAGAEAQAPDLEFIPPDASNRGYVLSGGDAKVVEIAGGSVKPRLPGTTRIGVTTLEGGFTDSFTVTVTLPDTSVHVQSVSVANLSLAVATRGVPEITWLPSNAPNRKYDLALVSGTSARAIGDSIEALSDGESVFKLTTRDSARTALFTVTAFTSVIPVQSVTAEPILSMVLGSPDRSPILTFSPVGATETAYTLSSKDTLVATVVSGNRLHAKATGRSEITVRVGTSVTTVFTLIVTAKADPFPIKDDLSALVVSAGSLEPPFSTLDTNYALKVPNEVVFTTLTVTFANPKTNVTLFTWLMYNKIASGSVNLKAGENVIPITLISPEGIKKTYRITITRAPNTNTTLSRLTVSAGTLNPAFHADSLAYTLTVPYSQSSTTLLPMASAAATSKVTVNGTEVSAGLSSGSIPLITGANTLLVVVTAESGDKRSYGVVINRLKNENANLASLSLSAGFIIPAFSPTSLRYTLSVANAIDSTRVTATAAVPAATRLLVNGLPLASGTASGNFPIKTGADSILVGVTADSGNSKTYTLVIYRDKNANADLAGLTVSAGAFTPAFSPSAYAYSLSVDSTVTGITVVPTVTATTSVITVMGVTVASGAASETIPLAAGANTIPVVVTAENGASKTYSLVVTRAISIGSYAKVAAGMNHTLILKPDGTLWATGMNAYGQLGDGTTTQRMTPVLVMSGVASMAAGSSHTLILKADGTLWGTGTNSSGQLGDGTTTNRYTPYQMMAGVAKVAAGSSFSLMIKTDGTLWATGQNTFGQLGDGTTSQHLTPFQVMTDVSKVEAGSSHTLIIKTDGSLWVMGSNASGQLGDGTTTSRTTPFQLMTGVACVAGGSQHTLIVKTDGSLWATGSNYAGGLGDGTTTSRSTPYQMITGVANVDAGDAFTLILKTDGWLWTVGYNNIGQLGDGTTSRHLSPVQMVAGVASVAAGPYNTFYVKTDGTVWGTGSNNTGQLGDGTTTDRLVPVQVSF